MTELQLLKEISVKLDKLIAVFSIYGKDENKQMAILKSQGLTYKDIGELLGVPEGTVKSSIHRTKKK